MKPNQNSHPYSTRLSENFFKYVSMDSWTTLVYQILKIYYLNRVTYSKFKSLSTVPEALQKLPEGYNEISTIYSPSEVILLRWIEVSATVIKNSNASLGYFDKDFLNGISYAVLLHHYTANSLRPLKHMKEKAIEEDDCAQNLKIVREALIDLGIPNLPNIEDMKKPNPRETVLFLVHLFHSLPYYLPKQTIEFECTLDETVIKNIMIQNPTSKPLTYYIKLEGVSDFSIDSDNVTVHPKQSGNYPVKFHARISRQVFARITFKSKKENGPMAAPLVFDLKSSVTGRHSVERIEIKTIKLYESGTYEVKITNPYPQDVEFLITLENLAAMTDIGNKFRRNKKNEG